MRTTTLEIPARAVAACAIAIPCTLTFIVSDATPAAHAENGDTHITGEGVNQTVDCNGATLLVNGTSNVVNALGTCYAVSVMGSGNTIVADTVTHDITVYGSDQSVFFHNGDPVIWDRGRELGMVNRIGRAAA